MEIFMPLSNKQIYIVENLLTPDEAQMCSDFCHARLFNSDKVTEEERLALGYIPTMQNFEEHKDEFDKIIKDAIETIKGLMRECFPEPRLELFKTYQDISVRTPEGGKLNGAMTPHIDGPGEIDRMDNGVQTVGGLLYINDNYEGGELSYPNLDYEYKPKAGSFVMHLGNDSDYLHGVNEIKNGWRFNLGIFGYEYYPEFDATMQYGDQGRDRFSKD